MTIIIAAIAAVVGFVAGGILGYGSGRKDRQPHQPPGPADPLDALRREYWAMVHNAESVERAARESDSLGLTRAAANQFARAASMRAEASRLAADIGSSRGRPPNVVPLRPRGAPR